MGQGGILLTLGHVVSRLDGECLQSGYRGAQGYG
jgi:hypothetical protein